MPRSTANRWGACPCGGHYEPRNIEVPMTLGDRHITLTDVPQGACPRCGSRVYKAGHLARLEATMYREPIDPVLARTPFRDRG